VFVSHSADLIAIAKSILMDAEIEFGVSGEHVQDFFGYGRFPVGVSVVAGPVTISVRAADAEDARVLLSKLGDDSVPFPEDDGAGATDAGELSGFWRASRFAARAYSFAYLAIIVGAVVVLWALQKAFELSGLWDSLIGTIRP
jgi:hypothetical protein